MKVIRIYLLKVYQGQQIGLSSTRGMNIDSFERLFNFPLLFSQRLFQYINKSKTGVITSKEFVDSIATLFSGSVKERLTMLFGLFDFNDDGIISTDDIILLTYHVSLRASYTNLNKIKQMICHQFKGKMNFDEFMNNIRLNSDLIWYLGYLFNKLSPLTAEVSSFLEDFYGFTSEGTESDDTSFSLNKPTTYLEQLLKNNDDDEEIRCLSLLDDFDQDIHLIKDKMNKSPVLKIFERNHFYPESSKKYLNIRTKDNEIYVDKITNDRREKVKLVYKDNQMFEFLMCRNKDYKLERIFLNWSKVYLGKKSILYEGVCYNSLIIKFDTEAVSYLCNNERETNAFIESINNLRLKNQKIHNKYTIDRLITKGGYSMIYLGFNNASGEKVAIKSIVKCDINPDMLKWEKEVFRILRKAPSKRIAEAIDLYENEKTVFLVYKYYEKLNWRSCSLTDNQIMEVSLQMIEGLQHLNELGIIHRDIKLDNVLLIRNQVNAFEIKLIDFGFARVISKEEKLTTRIGSSMYCSPEILLGYEYSFKVDMWSLGVIIYYLKYRKFPFTDEDLETTKTLLVNGMYSFPECKDPSLKYLISRCLAHSPERRIQASNIIYN